MFDENKITSYLEDVFRSTYNSYVIDGIGDDCAQLRIPNDQVITTDILVEGHHFLKGTPPEFIAQRSLAQNLADIASMGAKPVGIVVSLVLPINKSNKLADKNRSEIESFEWIKRFAKILAQEALRVGVAVVGGDLSSGEAITVNICAFGDSEKRKPVTRKGAKAGDILACTVWEGDYFYDGLLNTAPKTPLGISAYGFQKLNKLAKTEQVAKMNSLLDGSNINSFTDVAIRQYLTPHLNYNLGIVASENGATAMMDISDGLVVDVSRIAKASNVQIELFNSKQFRISEISPEHYYFGGEDHCLVATFPQNTSLPKGWVQIGKVLVSPDNSSKHSLVRGEELDGINGQVWDHFTGKSSVYCE